VTARGPIVAIAAIGVLGAAAVAVLAWHHDHRQPATEVAGFALVGAEQAGDIARIRHLRDLTISVADATCIGVDERPARELFAGFGLRETRRAVVASVRMQRRRGEFCVGLARGFTTTLHLSRPLGERALIEDEGPHQFRSILVPPAGRAAARSLVLPIRRDRKQPPPLLYTEPACDLVAAYLADVPKRDWCLY
jgi:hypothetical protein